jgi:hypothetical protein
MVGKGTRREGSRMNRIYKLYYKDGSTSDHYQENKTLHRVGGPAIECVDGSREWLIDGKRHRIDGPAAEYANGGREWWVDGKLHRVDGPAVVLSDKSKEWWVNDQLHRVDGPAVEFANGDKEWWIEGKLHRVDGPAVEYVYGDNEWWIDHERYTEYDFNNLIKQVNEMSLAMKLTDPRWWVRELGEKELHEQLLRCY